MDPAIPAIAGPCSFSSLPTFLWFKFGIISFNGGEFCHFFKSIDMLEGLWSSESILVLVCWAPKKNLSVDVWLWSCVSLCACLNVFVCVCFRMCVWGVVYLWKSSISCVFFLTCPYTTTPFNITNCSELILATSYYKLSKTVHVQILVALQV